MTPVGITKPSAKNSCSGSRLRLSNGKTAIEGFVGATKYIVIAIVILLLLMAFFLV